MHIPIILAIGLCVNALTTGSYIGLSLGNDTNADSTSLPALLERNRRHNVFLTKSPWSTNLMALRAKQVKTSQRERSTELQKIADQIRTDTISLAFNLNDVETEPEEFLYRVAICGMKLNPTDQVLSASKLWTVWQDLRGGKNPASIFSPPLRLYHDAIYWYKGGIWNEDFHVFAIAIRDIFLENPDQPLVCG